MGLRAARAAMADLAAVGRLMGRAPHCLNIRDITTGDTLLHHCANTGNTTLAAACFGMEYNVFYPTAMRDQADHSLGPGPLPSTHGRASSWKVACS